MRPLRDSFNFDMDFFFKPTKCCYKTYLCIFLDAQSMLQKTYQMYQLVDKLETPKV